jgi:glyoxylase-like metal-dependent hydrolase (beta-lactamase superfamily II)
MSKPLFLCALLMFTALAHADPNRTIADVAPKQVAPRTYVIHGPLEQPTPGNKAFINNPAFVLTDAGVVVVDPGSSLYVGEMVLRQVRSVTDKPVVAVLNTHVHGDHWLGNDAIHRAYPDAPIYAHPGMIKAVQEGAGDTWIDMFNRLTEQATEGTRVAAPTRPLTHGDEIEVGGVHFRVHHHDPAHTHTDIMIQVVEEDLLFTGDNANNGRIVRMDDGNFSGNIAALDMALALQTAHYVPGHGQSGGPELVQAYRTYLQNLYDKVALLFDEGVSDFEMKDQVHAVLAPYHGWAGYQTELGKHISLAYLQAEAAAF